MHNQTENIPSFSWPLIACWLIGLYLILGSAYTAWTLYSSWSTLTEMGVIETMGGPVLMALPWLLRLATGICFLIRSTWLLLAMPLWIGAFAWQIVRMNTWDTLPSDFFLALGIQGCMACFAIWLHAGAHLKR